MLSHQFSLLLVAISASLCAARYPSVNEQAPLTIVNAPSRASIGYGAPTPVPTTLSVEDDYHIDYNAEEGDADDEPEDAEDEDDYHKPPKKKTTTPKKPTTTPKKPTTTSHKTKPTSSSKSKKSKTSTSTSTTPSRTPTPVFPEKFNECQCGNSHLDKLNKSNVGIRVSQGAAATPRPTIYKNPSPTQVVPHLFRSDKFDGQWLNAACKGSNEKRPTNLVEWSWDSTGGTDRQYLYRVVYTTWDITDENSQPIFCGCMKHILYSTG
ncbi:hypothetical protein ONZ45_g15473 [Pleurotus djamor]|nr:hypothetical protein ONZ45_g15473 [Pleurotus djamor]